MSDVMLIGVLRMPPDIWGDDPISITQRHSVYEQAADRIEADEARIAELEAENQRLREAVDAFTALINESGGVYGLHLNGDLAPWDDLMVGGRYEDWLLPLALLGVHVRVGCPGR